MEELGYDYGGRREDYMAGVYAELCGATAEARRALRVASEDGGNPKNNVGAHYVCDDALSRIERVEAELEEAMEEAIKTREQVERVTDKVFNEVEPRKDGGLKEKVLDGTSRFISEVVIFIELVYCFAARALGIDLDGTLMPVAHPLAGYTVALDPFCGSEILRVDTSLGKVDIDLREETFVIEDWFIRTEKSLGKNWQDTVHAGYEPCMVYAERMVAGEHPDDDYVVYGTLGGMPIIVHDDEIAG